MKESIPPIERKRKAERAWAIGLSCAALYELTCDKGETLSEALDYPLSRRIGKHVTRAVIGMTAAHLANCLNPRVDPYHQLGRLISHVRGHEDGEDNV